MEQQLELTKVGLTWRSAFAAVLIIFILFGLGTKLVLSINMGFNSDSVGMGLEAMEIWKHQNYFLSGYYLPSQDTFIFTELLPFQLIPQILTNYDPTALRAMTFVEFALGMAILSYIVYSISGNFIPPLVFAAVTANLPVDGYQFFSFTTSHGGTIVFLGVIFALLLYMMKKDEGQTRRNRKGTKIQSKKVEWAYILGLSALVALTVISDTIILPWLIVPFIIAYILFVREKSSTMNIAVMAMAAVSAVVYIFKTYFVYTWVVQDIFSPRVTGDLYTMATLFFKAMAIMLNPGLYSVLEGFKGFGLLEALSLAVFAALAIFAVKKALDDKPRRLFYIILLASSVTMFGMWLISHYTVGIDSARYLTFTALTVFILIAMAYRPNDKVYDALVVGLLLISAIYCYVQLSQLQTPNAEEIGLITYLKDNNLTFGYGSYWKSNTITYLSGEDVTVRAVFFYRDDMRPGLWLACERWYQSTPDRSFILVDNSTMDDNIRGVVNALTENLNASEPLHYGRYDIYPIENYHIRPFQVQR